MIIDKSLSDLQTLATLCEEQADHLHADAERVDNKALQLVLHDLAVELDHLQQTLNIEVRQADELPREASVEQETLHDAYSIVKTVLTENADQSLLNERLAKYDMISDQVEALLSNDDLPSGYADLSESTIEMVIKHKTRLKKYLS